MDKLYIGNDFMLKQIPAEWTCYIWYILSVIL